MLGHYQEMVVVRGKGGWIARTFSYDDGQSVSQEPGVNVVRGRNCKNP